MKKIIILVLLFSVSMLFASFNDYEPSVRARGMSGAYTTISQESDGVFYNPAALNIGKNNVSLSSVKLFGNSFSTLNTASFSAKLPKKFGTLAFGLQAFDASYQGVDLTSEKKYSLAHSLCILGDIHSKIYVGYALNFYHLAIDTFGSQTSFGLNVGALAILHQRTRLGFTVSNINNPKIGKDNASDLPQKFAVGISYIPYEGVITALDLKKEFGEPTEIHAGTEVKIHKSFYLRAGVRNQPTSFSMGFRFTKFNINVDYSFNTHSVLGITHHFGIGYNF